MANMPGSLELPIGKRCRKVVHATLTTLASSDATSNPSRPRLIRSSSKLAWLPLKAARQQVMPDDHSEVEPPLPIPNRTVKRLCADDSEQLARESRSSSGKYSRKGPALRRPFFFGAASAPLCRAAVSSWCLRNSERQLDRVKKKRHNLASLLVTNLMSCQRRDL